MPDIIEGTNNLIDDYIKTYKLERLSEVTSNTLCEYYGACSKHCIYYKQYKQMLSLFEEMPIHPALLSLKAMEQKNLKNNLYLWIIRNNRRNRKRIGFITGKEKTPRKQPL